MVESTGVKWRPFLDGVCLTMYSYVYVPSFFHNQIGHDYDVLTIKKMNHLQSTKFCWKKDPFLQIYCGPKEVSPLVKDHYIQCHSDSPSLAVVMAPAAAYALLRTFKAAGNEQIKCIPRAPFTYATHWNTVCRVHQHIMSQFFCVSPYIVTTNPFLWLWGSYTSPNCKAQTLLYMILQTLPP